MDDQKLTTNQRDVRAAKFIVVLLAIGAIAFGVEKISTEQVSDSSARQCELNPDAC